MEYLLYGVAKSILALVRFAELRVEDGSMRKQHFIFPAVKTIRKSIRGIIRYVFLEHTPTLPRVFVNTS
jgi:hypothetical protein